MREAQEFCSEVKHSSAKYFFFLLHREAKQAMLYLGQKMRFHYIPWNITVVTSLLAASLVYSKQNFLIVK
jgi:hypothetical protein